MADDDPPYPDVELTPHRHAAPKHRSGEQLAGKKYIDGHIPVQGPAEEDPNVLRRISQVVSLRARHYTMDEIAEALGFSRQTIVKDWRRAQQLYAREALDTTTEIMLHSLRSYDELAKIAWLHLKKLPIGAPVAGVASMVQAISNIEWRRAMLLGIASDAMRRRYENMTDEQYRDEIAALARDAGLTRDVDDGDPTGDDGPPGIADDGAAALAPGQGECGQDAAPGGGEQADPPPRFDDPEFDPLPFLRRTGLSRLPPGQPSLPDRQDA